MDSEGLNKTGREILRLMIEKPAGGPAKLGPMAVELGEGRDTAEDIQEACLRNFLWDISTTDSRLSMPLHIEYIQ